MNGLRLRATTSLADRRRDALAADRRDPEPGRRHQRLHACKLSGRAGRRATRSASTPRRPRAIASNNGNALRAGWGCAMPALVDGKHGHRQLVATRMADVGVRVQTGRSRRPTSATADGRRRPRTASAAAQTGVNLDEEAARLIQFQQSYQAAAKVLQIAQSIFDTLLLDGRPPERGSEPTPCASVPGLRLRQATWRSLQKPPVRQLTEAQDPAHQPASACCKRQRRPGLRRHRRTRAGRACRRAEAQMPRAGRQQATRCSSPKAPWATAGEMLQQVREAAGQRRQRQLHRQRTRQKLRRPDPRPAQRPAGRGQPRGRLGPLPVRRPGQPTRPPLRDAPGGVVYDGLAQVRPQAAAGRGRRRWPWTAAPRSCRCPIGRQCRRTTDLGLRRAGPGRHGDLLTPGQQQHADRARSSPTGIAQRRRRGRTTCRRGAPAAGEALNRADSIADRLSAGQARRADRSQQRRGPGHAAGHLGLPEPADRLRCGPQDVLDGSAACRCCSICAKALKLNRSAQRVPSFMTRSRGARPGGPGLLPDGRSPAGHHRHPCSPCSPSGPTPHPTQQALLAALHDVWPVPATGGDLQLTLRPLDPAATAQRSASSAAAAAPAHPVSLNIASEAMLLGLMQAAPAAAPDGGGAGLHGQQTPRTRRRAAHACARRGARCW